MDGYREGKIKELPSNTGRKRININGAIDVSDLDFEYREDKTIDADSTIGLLSQLEQKNPDAEKIYVIADNARYNHAKKVEEYVKNSRIRLIFLPSYAPNLNLIEAIKRNSFTKRFSMTAIIALLADSKKLKINFFENILQYRDELNSLLTENFQIIGCSLSQT